MSSGIVSQSRLGRYDVLKPDDNYLGTVRKFMDKDWASPDSVRLLSGTWITAVYVQNKKGGAIAGGTGVVFKNTALGLRVDALSTANARCDGIADPFVASIPDNAYFWMIVSGPCDVLVGSGGVTQGDAIQTAVDGTFITLTDGNTYASGRAGIATETAAEAALSRSYVNLQYQALIPGC